MSKLFEKPTSELAFTELSEQLLLKHHHVFSNWLKAGGYTYFPELKDVYQELYLRGRVLGMKMKAALGDLESGLVSSDELTEQFEKEVGKPKIGNKAGQTLALLPLYITEALFNHALLSGQRDGIAKDPPALN